MFSQEVSTPWDKNIGLFTKLGGQQTSCAIEKNSRLYTFRVPGLETCCLRSQSPTDDLEICNCRPCLYYMGKGKAFFVGYLRGNSSTAKGSDIVLVHDAIRQKATP